MVDLLFPIYWGMKPLELLVLNNKMVATSLEEIWLSYIFCRRKWNALVVYKWWGILLVLHSLMVVSWNLNKELRIGIVVGCCWNIKGLCILRWYLFCVFCFYFISFANRHVLIFCVIEKIIVICFLIFFFVNIH